MSLNQFGHQSDEHQRAAEASGNKPKQVLESRKAGLL